MSRLGRRIERLEEVVEEEEAHRVQDSDDRFAKLLREYEGRNPFALVFGDLEDNRRAYELDQKIRERYQEHASDLSPVDERPFDFAPGLEKTDRWLHWVHERDPELVDWLDELWSLADPQTEEMAELLRENGLLPD